MKKIKRNMWFYSEECHALLQLARVEKYLLDKQNFFHGLPSTGFTSTKHVCVDNEFNRIAFEAAMWEIQSAKCRVYRTFELVGAKEVIPQ